MNDFINRSKVNYSQEASRQKRHVLSEQLKSELLFYRDDIRLLHHLIDQYFLWISKNEYRIGEQEMEVNLFKVEQECALLLERTNWNLKYFTQWSNDPFINHSGRLGVEGETL